MIAQLKRFNTDLKKHVGDLEAYLSNNGANHIEDYRFVTGQIAAYRNVEMMIEDAIQAVEVETLEADNDPDLEDVDLG